MPLISVIIPTHNRRELLLRAIDSVLKQTHEELEIIVIDDASTDGTQSAVLDLHEERIQYVRLPEQSGACAARNKGVDMARGEYIAFHDSDDVFHPDKLEKQLQYLTDTDADVGTRVTLFGDTPDQLAALSAYAKTIDYELLCAVSARVTREYRTTL